MELYKRIIEIVDANLILCLIPIILTLMLIELIFKNRFETKKVLNLIRWTIIVYTIITWTIAIALIGMPESFAFINRAQGPYKIAHLSALILPFTLLIKKFASKFWYVLLVAFCMKIGIYFDRFVMIVPSFYRDYPTENGNSEFMDLVFFGVGMQFLQGIIITILTLGIFEIIKRKKKMLNSGYEK